MIILRIILNEQRITGTLLGEFLKLVVCASMCTCICVLVSQPYPSYIYRPDDVSS